MNYMPHLLVVDLKNLTLSIMRYLFYFTCVVFHLSFYAQDSTSQKQGLFKLSGISTIGGFGSLSYLGGNNNQTKTSKQVLLSMWPSFAKEPFYNYTQWIGNYNDINNGGMFGVYLNFSNYSNKKKRYAKHSETNFGVTIFNQSGQFAQYTGIQSSRIDTLYSKSGTPFYYRDNVTINNANVSYHATNIGLDLQQLFSTNQKKIFSIYCGLAATVNFSILSQISYTQSQETGVNITSNPYLNYNAGTNYNLADKTDSTKGYGSYSTKATMLYQVYVPFGFNIRLGKNDNQVISHFYLTNQVRIGVEILKVPMANAFVYKVRYITFGLKYKFK